MPVPRPLLHKAAMASPPDIPHVFDAALGRMRLARAYRDGPVDFLLRRVADDLAERLSAVTRVFASGLDIGTPSPLLTQRLLAGGQVGAMLHLAPVAAALGPQGGGLADPAWLPVAPASVALAVSALALHGVDDLPGALAQIRRALQPDGLFLACLAGGQTLHELRTSFAGAEADITGGASPRVAPFADLRDLGGLLQRAGFTLPVTDADVVTVRYASMLALLADLRGMGATSNLVARSRRPLRRAVLLRAAEIYAQRFADADGRVRATFAFIWLSGWAPHASQRPPLQPGSARMRLADALGVAEIKP